MPLRDILYWIRSARSDKHLTDLLSKHEVGKAFDMLYTRYPDPWGCIPSFCQKQKYQSLLSYIPQRKYANAVDIGCGLGIFTRQLSGMADQVLGIDVSETAIYEARRLSKDNPSIQFQSTNLYDLKPDRLFDLVVISDVLYYVSPFNDEKIKAARQMVERLMAPGGTLLLANHFFIGFDKNSKETRRIHDAFRWSKSFRVVKERNFPFFLASVFEEFVPAAI